MDKLTLLMLLHRLEDMHCAQCDKPVDWQNDPMLFGGAIDVEGGCIFMIGACCRDTLDKNRLKEILQEAFPCS